MILLKTIDKLLDLIRCIVFDFKPTYCEKLKILRSGLFTYIMIKHEKI